MSHQAGFTQGSTIFFIFRPWGRFPVLTRLFFRGGKKPTVPSHRRNPGTTWEAGPNYAAAEAPKRNKRVISVVFWNQRCLGMFLINIVGRIQLPWRSSAFFNFSFVIFDNAAAHSKTNGNRFGWLQQWWRSWEHHILAECQRTLLALDLHFSAPSYCEPP